MTNADKFKHLFGIYATELWAMSENDFLEWLNADAQDMPTGKWIPCSERLPEDGKWCLFTDGVSMSVERYKADAMDHFFPAGRWFDFEDAFAWTPLPEPYAERREE